jgi:LysR family cys regulon transcriptional activator
MTLQQLRILREIERQSLSISAAAKALHTSQPGVSRQIQMLERGLGVPLLVRQKNRIVAFSPVGRSILAVAKSLLNQASNIELIAEESRGHRGRLVVATSHLHARYTLLQPFKALRKKYPHVQMLLFQADPADIPQLVTEHEADIGLNSTDEEQGLPKGIVCVRGNLIRRSAVMLRTHPLARKKRLTIRDLAAHPLVGYNPRSTAGRMIAHAFEQSGAVPNVIVQANDSDVIKAYVAEGLGFGIVPTAILDCELDADMRAVDVTALFPRASTSILIREDMHMPAHVREFIQMIAPAWQPTASRRGEQSWEYRKNN